MFISFTTVGYAVFMMRRSREPLIDIKTYETMHRKINGISKTLSKVNPVKKCK